MESPSSKIIKRQPEPHTEPGGLQKGQVDLLKRVLSDQCRMDTTAAGLSLSH